jgi:hypothetical protein
MSYLEYANPREAFVKLKPSAEGTSKD